MSLESKIESVLFFKNEPMTLAELSKLLNVPREDLKNTIFKLQTEYRDRGIVIVTNGDEISFGTHQDNFELIEKLQKEELSRDIGRAGLETLSIVLYRGPVSRREIDHIRGVNSGYILRSLLIRGLIERAEIANERSYSYSPTLKLLEYLGVTRREELPEFETALKKVEEFIKTEPEDEND